MAPKGKPHGVSKAHAGEAPSSPVPVQELRIGETLIHYHVVRSARRRKTVQITIDPVRGVRVAAPLRTSDTRIAEIVARRAGWIVRTSSFEAARSAPRSFVDGETFMYLGCKVPLVVSLDAVKAPSVALREWRLHVTLPPESDSMASTKRALLSWFQARALERLIEAVARWAAFMGLAARQVLVRDQRTLWGSCAADGTLRFNWRSVQVAPELMDYIVVHELAHLRHRSHSPKFWGEVARYVPDHLERRRRLREAARTLGW